MKYPNAIAFRKDVHSNEKELLVNDTGARAIHVVPLTDDGKSQAGMPSTCIKLQGMLGAPDGIALDKDGNIWTTEWFGSKVSCWSTAGTMLRAIDLPDRNVTSICFAGMEKDVLVVTTSSVIWDDEDAKALQPAGQDFTVDHLGGGSTYAIWMK